MNAINDGGPAFPQHGWSSNPEVLDRMKSQGGMPLRDWFAGQALCGLCANTNADGIDDIATNAYALSDAMLAARNGGKS